MLTLSNYPSDSYADSNYFTLDTNSENISGGESIALDVAELCGNMFSRQSQIFVLMASRKRNGKTL